MGADVATRLVLLPGWCETGGVFERLVPLLPATVTPLVVELAVSDIVDWSVRGLAARVAAVLDTRSGGRTVVLGTSSGGYVAQQLAVDRPDLVDALVLVGSPVDLRARPPFADEVDRLTDPISPARARASFDWLVAGTSIPAGFLDARAADAAALGSHVWQESLAGLVASAPPTSCGAVTAPTLVLSGALDDAVGGSHDLLLAAIPRSHGVVYDGTGHLVLWERPERVAADVTRFVADLAAGA